MGNGVTTEQDVPTQTIELADGTSIEFVALAPFEWERLKAAASPPTELRSMLRDYFDALDLERAHPLMYRKQVETNERILRDWMNRP